jgi:hypothetical protein
MVRQWPGVIGSFGRDLSISQHALAVRPPKEGVSGGLPRTIASPPPDELMSNEAILRILLGQ